MTESIDLVGGQFAVIESDPGVFTTLTHKLGLKTLSFVEVYDTASHAIDHLNPQGLIFCYLWRKESPIEQSPEVDEDAENVWFANQLIDDGCATQAILNIVLNCEGVQIGEKLEQFKAFTDKMSPVMKGLAISNSRDIREAHNSLARPSDIRGALYAAEKATESAAKALKAKLKSRADTHASKKRKVAPNKFKPAAQEKDTVDAYHFIAYVPAHGRVWELDGLKGSPLDVGLFGQGETWMDIVRPAIRMKMQKFGGDGTGDIRFSLLALVDDSYCRASDQLELEKRRRLKIEARMQNELEDWKQEVDQNLLFVSETLPSTTVPFFAQNLGHRRQASDMEILELPVRRLPEAWNQCIQKLTQASFPMEDELKNAERAHTDQIKRTFDYAPFLREFVKELHLAGALNEAAGRDSKGNKIRPPKPKVNKDANGDDNITNAMTIP